MPQRLRYGKAFPERPSRAVQPWKSNQREWSRTCTRGTGKDTGLADEWMPPTALDMHTKDARAAGETEQRLYALSAWEETPFYTPRERAALAWTEAITKHPGRGMRATRSTKTVRKEIH